MKDASFMQAVESSVLAFLEGCPRCPTRRRRSDSAEHDPLANNSCGIRCWSGRRLRGAALMDAAQRFFLLERLVRHRRDGICCTERSLYYREPALFAAGQAGIQRAIRRVCRWLDMATHETAPAHTRESLGIVANGKCVLVGSIALKVVEPDGRCWTLSPRAHGPHGWQITSDVVSHIERCHGLPPGTGPPAVSLRGAAHALVLVEKECALQTLIEAEQALRPHSGTQLILLCTRGYPCVAARLFLRRLHASWPTLPFFAITDGDAHGIDIALSMMSSSVPGDDSLPVEWLGVRPSQLLHDQHDAARHRLLPATVHDTALLHRLEHRLTAAIHNTTSSPVVQHTHRTMLKETQWMLRSKTKCEIEALHPHPILRYLEERSASNTFTTHSPTC
eukprot:gene5212-3732_t